MNNLHVLKSCRKYNPFLRRAFVNRLVSRCSNNSGKNEENDGATEGNKKENENKTAQAASRLNKLLLQMADDSATGKTKLDLAKPIPRKKDTKVAPEEPTVNFEKRIQSAARDVAHSLGNDEKRVESELLSKLLNVSSKSDTDTAVTLRSIVKGMKIERDTKSSEQLSRAQQVRQLLDMTKRNDVRTKSVQARPDKRVRSIGSLKSNIQKVDLFGAEPLALFSKDLKDEGVTNNKWRVLHEKELQLAVTHPPANYFQQMIQWTEASKIWKFPIDNEQGMEVEKSVYFTEHVFLEKHLEPWCPPKGPVRHFMELVCVGLSKNPYMTVETKREHIEWYRKYFEDKIQLLKEIGAIPTKSKGETSTVISGN